MTESQWKWADLVVKTLGVAIITGAITLYGIKSRESQQELARIAADAQKDRDRKERQMNALVEFASAQKQLDVDVGMQLFRAFIDKYLDVSVQSIDEIRENVVLLRLIALNFQDVPINLKPLFEDLDRQIKDRLRNQDQDIFGHMPSHDPTQSEPSEAGENPAGRAQNENDVLQELRKELREVAKEVANRQAFRLTFLHGEHTKFPLTGNNATGFFKSVPYAVQLKSIEEDEVEVEIIETEFNDQFEPTVSPDGRRIGPFMLSYFDMPILDNVKINDTTRLAVLLTDINGDDVTMRAVSFQSDLATDRFDVKEMSRSIIDNTIQEERKRAAE
jgi:hypothetical protein